MEFKGTKGTWSYRENYDEKYSQPTLIIGNETYSEFITIWTGLERYDEIDIETKANALLISKAPEMLEMLQIILQSENTPIVHRKKVKQLIKEATEL